MSLVNTPEQREAKDYYYERTQEEIDDTNQRYNNYFDNLLESGSDLNSTDVAYAMEEDSRSALGADSSLTGSGIEGFSENVDETAKNLEGSNTSESAIFSHSIEVARNEVHKELSSSGIRDINESNVAERTLGAKLEAVAHKEDVVGGAEFLNQASLDQVKDASLAEQVIESLDSDDADTIAYIQKLTQESESVRSLITTAKNAGGVNRLSNEKLAEFGKDIRKSDITVESAASEQKDTEKNINNSQNAALSYTLENDVSHGVKFGVDKKESAQQVNGRSDLLAHDRFVR